MVKPASRKVIVPAKPVEPVKAAPVKPVKRSVQVTAQPKPVEVPTIKLDMPKKGKPFVGNTEAEVGKAVRKVTKTARVEHGIASLYTGSSPGLNKRKSSTVLDLSLYNTKPDYILSERSELVAETIKKEYGNKPFQRANLDAGVLKHLLMKGFIEAVSGQGGEDTTLRFTKNGLAYHRKAA